MKIVINECYGEFSISAEAALLCYKRGMSSVATPIDEYFTREDTGDRFGRSAQLAAWREYLKTPAAKRDRHTMIFLTVFSPDEKFVLTTRPINRTDPVLIGVVEQLKAKADGDLAKLAVHELPAGTHYRIGEYDGTEWIEERDKIEWEVAT